MTHRLRRAHIVIIINISNDNFVYLNWVRDDAGVDVGAGGSAMLRG